MSNDASPVSSSARRKQILQKTQGLDNDSLSDNIGGSENNLRSRSKAHPIFKTTSTSSTPPKSTKFFSQLVNDQEFGNNHVWVLSSNLKPQQQLQNQLYQMGKLLDREGNVVNVELLNITDPKKKMTQLPVMDVTFMNPPGMSKLEDLTQLTNVNEPCILHHLKSRLEDNKNPVVFTDCGGFASLISTCVNGNVRDGKISQKLPNQVLNKLNLTGENQSIIVTGDSNSGKSTTTKLLLESFGDLTNSKIVTKALDALKIIEIFSSSPTEQSKHSSRVSKKIGLQFTNSSLTGVYFDCLNLEMTRSVIRVMEKISEKEGIPVEEIEFKLGFINNFQVFYQLLADEKLRAKFKLTQLLNKEMELKENFSSIEKLFLNVGFTENNIGDIVKILCALLHLNNCDFIENESNTSALTKLSENSFASFYRATRLLGVDDKDLLFTMIKPTVSVGDSFVDTFVNAKQASHNRDLMVMTLYNGLFEWIVKKINELLKNSESNREISLLDIGTGFESIATGVDAARGVKYNGLEQLLINYANERFKELIHDKLFNAEQETYKSENIEWKQIDFSPFSTKSVLLSALEDSTDGLFSILKKETLSMYKGSDEGAIIKELTKAFSGKSEQVFKPNLVDLEFSLGHFNGKVTYKVLDWFQKSVHPISSMPQQSREFLAKNSKNTIVQAVYSTLLDVSTTVEFTSDTYVKNVERLLSSIGSSKHIYPIICVRNTSSGSSLAFNDKLVQKQVRNYGILEIIKLARKGYSSKFTFEKFVERFSSLVPSSKLSKDAKESSVTILEEHKIEHKLGTSLVFLRGSAEANLTALIK